MPHPPPPPVPTPPEPPTSPVIQQLLSAVSKEVSRLGVVDAIFGVVDPSTGAVRVIHTKDIDKHADTKAEKRHELRKRIAEKLDLADPNVITMGGFGARF